MICQRSAKSLAIVSLVTLMLFQGPGVSAAGQTYWNYGDVTTYDYAKYYSNPPYVTGSPYGIAFRMDPGTPTRMKWIFCGSTGGGAFTPYMHGAYGWAWLRYNNPGGSPLTFCMAIQGLGYSNSFSGLLDWD